MFQRCFLSLSTISAQQETLLNLTLNGTVPQPGTPAEPCSGYLVNLTDWVNETGPFPIFCENQTYVAWGPPEHQDSSCCADEGRFVVQNSVVGGFDIAYKTGLMNLDGIHYECVAYTEALRAVLCDPRQGDNVRLAEDNVTTLLRICRSSCDAVYEKCGPPGVNYPADLTYTNGRTLCREAWGGWYTSPCEQNPTQFPCQGLTTVEIVDGDDCLPIIYPTEETLQSYKERKHPPDACAPPEPSRVGIIVFVTLTVVVSLGICALLIFLYARHRQKEEDFSRGG
jgi:hypothetical protein